MTTPKPLGYWLKHLDTLIETRFGRTLADHGLTRRHWQVLNTIAAAPTSQEDLDRALAPFQQDVRAEVDDLIAKGWAARDGDLVTTTELGRAGFDEVAARIHTERRRIIDGIPDEEYLRTVETLRRMAANLE
ncbi:MarR family winged helix-turn-helix transcriptional regulator [Labedaea rhizosphaerae]|uniref:DNA-binding MarR family transcriptional regulator n=1 Tax=Labedaea rhizosphaerae TaxID=598644 RepID=A0A4R6SP42_LABRH|nr:MarR family transcriptional regulator [Labedaea rhizosphaerae]TDQ05212.1 DNA-binding MarR family transcriptional regulator [Labedaea rhizosphaerae]